MAVLPPYPSFLIVGFRRNALRWLRHNLDHHPDICAPPVYSSFFVSDERMVEIGLRGYLEQFVEWNGEPIVGEASWAYLDWSNHPAGVADRIRRRLPDVRLIAIVDHPVTRFVSSFRNQIRWGHLPSDIDAEAFYLFKERGADAINLIVEGMQTPSLRPFHDRFGDQMRIVFMDDIRNDPHAAYAGILRHIGADPSFVPPNLEVVRYSNRPYVDVPEPSLEARQLIYAWYRPDVEIIQDMTGRDLSSWDPGVGPDTPTAEDILALLIPGSGRAAS